VQFRREDEDNFALDLTPLIDVVFLLLIFFMVSTVFVDFNRRMDLTLPSSKSSSTEDPGEVLTIELTADQKMFFQGTQISISQLESKLRDVIKAGGKKSAVVRADKGLSFGKVIEVMGILRAEKIEDISVAVK
jgi:biopolymer transport protein ExbD